jgi:hypothetical protein
MSTTTVKQPKGATNPPEWRRLCHYYDWESERSLCGAGGRELGVYHFEAECRSRGHTICVVRTECVKLLPSFVRSRHIADLGRASGCFRRVRRLDSDGRQHRASSVNCAHVAGGRLPWA